MKTEAKVSFITPVYNEELNIARMLRNLHTVLSRYPDWEWEVILIEDGSKDGTRKVLSEEIKKYPNTHLILHDRNQGYTQSLKDGIAKARGEFLMYIGADEEFDCAEIPAFINPLLSQEADLVLGVRWQRNAYQLFRFFLSVIYIFFLNYIFKLRVNDYNWSQAWSKKFLDRIQMRSKSLFVLPEIIIKAYDLKCRVKEIPSNHRGRQAGKSSISLRIMGYALLDAVRFWFYRQSRRYQPAAPPGTVKKNPAVLAATS